MMFPHGQQWDLFSVRILVPATMTNAMERDIYFEVPVVLRPLMACC